MRFLLPLALALFLVTLSWAEGTPASMEEKLQRTRDLVTQGNTGPSPVEQNQREMDMHAAAWNILQTLALLVGIVLVGAWAYKKYVLKDTGTAVKRLTVLERIPIAPRASLMVTEIEGRRVLVGLTPDSIALLDLGTHRDTFAADLKQELES